MKTILINPAPYGNGPYIVCLKFARQLDNLMGETSIKIVPFYNQSQESENLQRKILTEFNFSEDVFLDPVFGSLTKLEV